MVSLSSLRFEQLFFHPSETPTAYGGNKKHEVFPDDLTVQKGDTVRWINHDIVVHDVTEEGNPERTSSVISSGESWETEITDVFQYYCSIHMVMKGQVKVE